MYDFPELARVQNYVIGATGCRPSHTQAWCEPSKQMSPRADPAGMDFQLVSDSKQLVEALSHTGICIPMHVFGLCCVMGVMGTLAA